MKLVAITPLRNEGWICGATLRASLMWVDEVVVLAHACTDNTVDIVQRVSSEHPGRVHLIVENDPNWPEMGHRQRLLLAARQRGATHIAICDGDEILCGDMLPGIRDQIAQLPAGAYMHCGMRCIWRGLTNYRTDGRVWSERYDFCLAFADRHDLKWERVNNYDHHAREPHGSRVAFRAYGQSGCMHLQWVSWRRLLAKQTWYQLMERIKYPAKPAYEIAHRYHFAMDETGLTVAATPAAWWEPYRDLMPLIDLDAPSWHEQECERLIAEHGIERFAGLRLANLEMANASR